MRSFDDYKGTLPYASELFGVYQPLLGWKSRIITRRFERYRTALYDGLAARALAATRAPVQIKMVGGDPAVLSAASERNTFQVETLAAADLERPSEPRIAPTIDSGIARMLLKEIGDAPPADWRRVITADRIDKLLENFRAIVSDPSKLRKHDVLNDYVETFKKSYLKARTSVMLQALFENESKVAGYLLFLGTHTPSSIEPLFFRTPKVRLSQAAQVEDPLLSFGENAYDAILSPVGVIHLYRQYFFEFESFLGPPVGHVWLSPGGTVELIEVATRRTLTERTFEQSLETTMRSESEVTIKDDIADAVKEENRDSAKFGFSATGSYSAAVYSANATADLSIENAKAAARETTHQQMRQQSEKLSSEIKRNFKTTFKTSTEESETSSKRYVLSNNTNKLVNYELRRKMRTVGVQVQDIGVALCWHTFVDDAGRDLGVAKLVHIGQPPELGDLIQPDAPQSPTIQTQDVNLTIPFVGINTDDTDNDYTNGADYDWGNEYIQYEFEQRVLFSTPGFTLAAVDVQAQGVDANLSIQSLASVAGSSAGTFTIRIDYVNWGGKDQIPVKMKLHWSPSQAMRDAINEQYEARVTEYNNEKGRRFKEAYYEAARARVTLASGIIPRPAEDLREEERTVIYRALISQLMSAGTHQSKHVISELVRSIFDVDKMLYFVAPEWWAPRLHRSTQQLGQEPGSSGGRGGGAAARGSVANISNLRNAEAEADVSGEVSTGRSSTLGAGISAENLVDWGGARELNRDNYYITEDSREAKLGSSLGWLLQLDGDDLRNALLNSPWVKAVIPIRIGKERAALNWLRQAHVEGADGLDATYVPSGDPEDPGVPPGSPTTVGEALELLIDRIQEFDRTSRTPIVGNPSDPDDVTNHFAGSLPTEAVFENGFYPLKGGVRFTGDSTEQPIISQWMEILPTDQVAAMEVEYDPKTLRVREVPAGDPPES